MLKKFLSGRDFSGVIIVTIGTYIASFFSYLLQFFLGRLLSIEDYGTFSAFLSLSYLLGVPAGVFSTALVKYVSDQSGKEDFHKLSAMYYKLLKGSISLGILLFVILVILRTYISSYLKIDDGSLVISFALLMSGTYVTVIPLGYLQGLLRYRSYSLTMVVFSFLRFLMPVLFVILGYKLYGVFGGMTVSMVIGTIFGLKLLKRNIVSLSTEDISSDVKKIIDFSLPVMFVTFGLTLLNNIDVILVKRLFSPEDAGYYAGVVTLGKILLFGTSTISLVMYPKISHMFAQKVSVTKKVLFFTFLQFGVVCLGTLVFNIFPRLLTTVFFGQRFSASIPYLPMFSIFIGLYVMVNFFVLLLLAINKTKVFMFLLPAVLVQYFLISNSVENLSDVIKVNVYITAILLVIICAYVVKSIRFYSLKLQESLSS